MVPLIRLSPHISKSNHDELFGEEISCISSLQPCGKTRSISAVQTTVIDVCHLRDCLYSLSKHLRRLSEDGCFNSPYFPAYRAILAVLAACASLANSVDHHWFLRPIVGPKVVFLDEYFRAVGDVTNFQDEDCAQRYQDIRALWTIQFQQLLRYCEDTGSKSLPDLTLTMNRGNSKSSGIVNTIRDTEAT